MFVIVLFSGKTSHIFTDGWEEDDDDFDDGDATNDERRRRRCDVVVCGENKDEDDFENICDDGDDARAKQQSSVWCDQRKEGLVVVRVQHHRVEKRICRRRFCRGEVAWDDDVETTTQRDVSQSVSL